MNVFILGYPLSKSSFLAQKISQMYSIPSFSIRDILYDLNHHMRTEEEQISIYNQIIRKNSQWIIEGIPDTGLEILSSSASTIIFFDFSMKQFYRKIRLRHLFQSIGFIQKEIMNQEFHDSLKRYEKNYYSNKMKEYCKKYSRKIIIIRNYNDYRKLLKAIEKGIEL